MNYFELFSDLLYRISAGRRTYCCIVERRCKPNVCLIFDIVLPFSVSSWLCKIASLISSWNWWNISRPEDRCEVKRKHKKMVNNSEIAKRDIPDNEFTESFWLTDESKNSSTRLWLKSSPSLPKCKWKDNYTVMWLVNCCHEAGIRTHKYQ